MKLEQRKEAIVRLGQWMGDIESNDEVMGLIARERSHNGWFTKDNVLAAMKAWSRSLASEKVEQWLSAYPELDQDKPEKRVGVVMAGNIPLVGLHDLLTVLLSGNTALVKISRDDDRLIPLVMQQLKEPEPGFKGQMIPVIGKMEDFDAVIATGSNNTSRYFEYYFGKVPNIIRKNRTSVAVLTGEESEEELTLLADDVFTHFGLGCRNVTKVYMPQDFELDRLFGAFYHYHKIGEHNKYANNYDYHKALWLLNHEDLLENGFLLMKEDAQLVSPVGSLFYERYADLASAEAVIAQNREQIQCIVGQGHLPFGSAQQPELWDYADEVDTLRFLIDLN
ncbi:MAG: acyl-CoA reductase [Flavobacteriales bacterium]|nr:acyl-CoA reductase [Flavobacteriales bacterium]